MKTPYLRYLDIAWLSFFHHLKFIFKSLLCKLISWCISSVSAFLLSLLNLRMKNDKTVLNAYLFSPTSIELFLSITFLTPALPALKSMEAVVDFVCSMPSHGCVHVACRVRVQFSGNELLKTGLWAHDITTSLNLTAKTNSGNCFGLCWISMPPWLLLIHWEGDACCWSVRLKKAGRGLAQGAAKLESSRLGKAWWNVAKGEWFLTAQLSSGNHQQTASERPWEFVVRKSISPWAPCGVK